MAGIAILFMLIGAVLLTAPDAWRRLNAPLGQKGQKPTDADLRRTRRQGLLFLLGGLALLLMQLRHA